MSDEQKPDQPERDCENPKLSPQLKELYKTENILNQILFYDLEQAIEMIKTVSTLKCSHARKIYCHHAGRATKKMYSTKKNNCTRNAGFKQLTGSTYYKNRNTKYESYLYVMLDNSDLMSIRNYHLDKDHTYFKLFLVGDHDNQIQYPCCQEQTLKYNFSPEEDELIKANLLEHQGVNFINLLLKRGQKNMILKCTYQQLRRHAVLMAKILLPDDVLIAKHVEEFPNLKYEIVKDQKTLQLSGLGVVNQKYIDIFQNDGGSVIFCDFTHIRLQNQNMMVLIISSQTVGSKFTYILGAYLFRNKENKSFQGETDLQVEQSFKFFKKHIDFSKTRLCLSDFGGAVAKVHQQLNKHTIGGLCAWHWWQNFKQSYGSESNSVRFLFFSLMRSPTEADFQFRENQLKDKLKSIQLKVFNLSVEYSFIEDSDSNISEKDQDSTKKVIYEENRVKLLAKCQQLLVEIADNPDINDEALSTIVTYLETLNKGNNFKNNNPQQNQPGQFKRIQSKTEKLFKSFLALRNKGKV
ncbi:Hypothetical_protein [Hexamita inflata]|uniref:Hypothetical_protein n=1 Tax=Hexamita inflata TaxID=28002 RepID=A0AA86PMX9_9EUKA|nr:Hypothetical protein HINF_LOCUS30141 [Hexamita inflata]